MRYEKPEIPEMIGGPDASPTEMSSNGKRNIFKSPEEIQGYIIRKGTHFVLTYGSPGSGKTAMMSSILYHLKNPKKPLGSLDEFAYDEDARYEKTNLQLLRIVSERIGNKKFPDRTALGTINHVNFRYSPKAKGRPHIPVTFLDISGEDLTLKRRGDDDSELPAEIDILFLADRKRVSLRLILVTSVRNAHAEDKSIARFLDYLWQKDPRLKTIDTLLLVSQWDQRQGSTTVEQLVERDMPETYSRLRQGGFSFRGFSLGRVEKIKDEAGNLNDYIVEYDEAPARKTWQWIYKSITKRDLIPLWKRLLNVD